MKAVLRIPRDVVRKLGTSEKLTEEDMASVTCTGPVCDYCGETFDAATLADETKRVDARTATEDELSHAEIIWTAFSVPEYGYLSLRRYHAACYWKQDEEWARSMRPAAGQATEA